MAKRVAGTLLEKHGFAEQDLYESKHDEICAWVDDNAQRILAEAFASQISCWDYWIGALQWGKLEEIKKAAHKEAVRTLSSDNIEEAMTFRVTQAASHNICEKSHKIDELKREYGSFLAKLFACRLNKLAVDVEWEVPLPQFSGFIDLVITHTAGSGSTFSGGTPTECYCAGTQTKYYVEVKTRIESIGSILRELQFYKAKSGAPSKQRIILVCPPHPGLERVRKQGFTVVEYSKDRFGKQPGAKRQCGGIQVW